MKNKFTSRLNHCFILHNLYYYVRIAVVDYFSKMYPAGYGLLLRRYKHVY